MTSASEQTALRRILERLSSGAATLDRLSADEQAIVLRGLATAALGPRSVDEIADETMALLHEVISSRLLIVAERNPELARTLLRRKMAV